MIRSLLTLALLVLMLGTAVCLHGALSWPQAGVLWLPAMVGAALSWVCFQLRGAAADVAEFQQLSPREQRQRAPEIFAATRTTLQRTIEAGDQKLQSFWLSGRQRSRIRDEVDTARRQLALVEVSIARYWQHVERESLPDA